MTIFDYFVVIVVALSLLIGVWRGVVSEILALLAWVAAFVVARTWASDAGQVLVDHTSEAAWQQLAGFVAIFVSVLVLFALGRWIVSMLVKAVGLGSLDRLLGAVFGIARGLFVVWVVTLLAGLSDLPKQAWWRQAILSPPFETAVLASKPWLPSDLAKRIRYR